MVQRYRPDIDGLRAIAVIAVVVYHAFPALMPGGFIGVDIFFVISGYLITGIIVRELDAKTFSFADFYARRVRRIFPALIVVLAISLATGFYFYLPSELSSLAKNAAASTASSANLMLLSESGYFDSEAHTKPLLHLWSLGIEEQFYLVWPFLLWLTPQRLRAVLIGVVIIGSFALNIALVKAHPQATFYLPFTRAWELIAGAALVGLSVQRAGAREALSALSIACGLAFFRFRDHAPFPDWAALVPVIGSAAAILAEGSLFNRLLSQPVAVFVGRISYPLYLWHWPLLVFARAYLFRPLTLVETALLVAAALVLAWLTYETIERPIRSGKFGGAKTAIAGMFAIAVFAAIALRLPPQLPDNISHIVSVSTGAPEWRIHQCALIDGDRDFAPDCIDNKRPLIAIWGDSTAGALMPGLRKIQSDRFGLAEFSVSSCLPLLVPGYSTNQACLQRNREIIKLIADAKPDVVALEALWAITSPDELRPTIDALHGIGVRRIIILGRIPVWTGGLPNAVDVYWRRTRELIPERTRLFVEEMSPGPEPMQIVADALHVDLFSIREVMCNADGCLTRIGDDLVTSDWLHLTPVGATYVAKAFAPRLLALLRSP